MRAHIPIVTLMLLVTPVVVPGLTAATVNAEVITVCWDGSGDYLTIQEGIDAASGGDEVIVCDGTYTGPLNKNLDFGGKAITVRSANGPDNCIIDCQDDGRGFYFHSGESEAAVVDGFTIRNGYVDWDSPGEANGAGIYCGFNTNPTIANCTITGNTAYGGGGGGIRCVSDSSPTIINCTITGNTAGAHSGGGIGAFGGSPTITGCTIMGNTADDNGGGISCGLGSATITNCTITGNTSTYFGGGVFCECGDLTLVNSTITGNTAGDGGGVSCLDGGATIANCTITGNTAYGSGGAFHCYQNSPTIANCILWADAAPRGPEISVIYTTRPATPTVSYSNVEGGEAAAYVDDGCALNWGPGNIDADPLFVDPDNGDYHLGAGSPCIDAGCNWGVSPDIADLDDDGDTNESTPLDLDGEGRFFDDPDTDDTGCTCPPIVDMGAYEFGETGPQPCLGDLDCDRVVGHSDLGILLAAWHSSGDGDLNCDGDTDHADLGILLAHWGEGCP